MFAMSAAVVELQYTCNNYHTFDYSVWLSAKVMAGLSANRSSLNETEIPSWIRGFHVCRDTWETEIGKVLDLIHEPNNEHDKNAIAVMKDNDVAGHAQWALANTKQGTGIIRHFLTKKGSKRQI